MELAVEHALDHEAYLAVIREQSERFLEVLVGVPTDAPVPTCDGWPAGDLLWHLGEVQHTWAHVAAGAGADEPEEAPASWLMPVYTREFYDSLAGWDRRVQRAAFKQAALLAQDHRHPSLRALPLEGLPGYYRVRVATDVRLLYRRGERQNEIEILSLIDREDLDRYVRQAKTRQ
jgi:hypothetical protein